MVNPGARLSPLQAALECGLAPGGDLDAALERLGDYSLSTEADARALASAIETLASSMALGKARAGDHGALVYSLLHRVVVLVQSVETREAYDILRERSIPRLLEVFDARLNAGDPDETDDLLFLLKVAAMYRVEGAVERIAAAARVPLLRDGFLWTAIIAAFDQNHPYRLALLNRLREPFPGGEACAAYLDLANTMVREGLVTDHPFNTREGRARLRSFLTDRDMRHAGRALSASRSLVAIDRPDRDELLALAMDHPHEPVQMESAWAAARLGSEGAIKLLARACLDPKQSKRAVAYLTELGQGGRIPSEARDPDFQAIAELSAWLAHPMEFGRPPDEIAVVDSRELNWPPTNDRRRLWVVRYGYEQSPGGRAGESGYGLVGSVTFALFSEATLEMTPGDVYALHCCWELEMRHDPRAPKPRSVEAGRSILSESNPGW